MLDDSVSLLLVAWSLRFRPPQKLGLTPLSLVSGPSESMAVCWRRDVAQCGCAVRPRGVWSIIDSLRATWIALAQLEATLALADGQCLHQLCAHLLETLVLWHVDGVGARVRNLQQAEVSMNMNVYISTRMTTSNACACARGQMGR